MFSNMAAALLKHEQIHTTLAKAKELRPVIEKLITLGKKGSLHDRRRAISKLSPDAKVDKLFEELAKRYSTRNGGYTRIIKAGSRYGDCAPMAYIELVDRNEEAKGIDSGPIESKKDLDKKESDKED
jgi:large subunit ribosomal protein L17